MKLSQMFIMAISSVWLYSLWIHSVNCCGASRRWKSGILSRKQNFNSFRSINIVMTRRHRKTLQTQNSSDANQNERLTWSEQSSSQVAQITRSPLSPPTLIVRLLLVRVEIVDGNLPWAYISSILPSSPSGEKSTINRTKTQRFQKIDAMIRSYLWTIVPTEHFKSKEFDFAWNVQIFKIT